MSRAGAQSIRAAVVAGLLIAAAMAAPGSAGAGPAACARGALFVAMGVVPGSQGAGNQDYAILVTNVSSKSCVIGRRPRLLLLGARARALPTHARYFGASGSLTLGAGGEARALARFSPDVPGVGEPTTGPCEPRAFFIFVTLGAAGGGSVIGTVAPPTPVCEHGTMSLSALAPVLVLHRI